MRSIFVLASLCALFFSSFGEELKIAAFNIQVFGEKKMEDERVTEVLVQILSRYDVIVVQEIRDQTQECVPRLVRLLSVHTGKRYHHLLSIREGRTRSKEQYAIIYLQKKFSIQQSVSYVDSQDRFERSPWFLRVKAAKRGSTEFIMGVLHSDPDDVKDELNALYSTTSQMQHLWNTNNTLLLGDFNADCNYLSNRKEMALDFMKDPRWYFLIRRGVDTTVAATHCAYDRFITTGDEMIRMIRFSSIGIYQFDKELGLTRSEAKDVSDHYPIELTLDI